MKPSSPMARRTRRGLIVSRFCWPRIAPPANGASHLIFADGQFRDAPGFARTFLLFPPDGAPAARQAWRAQDGREDVERAYFAQENGRWVTKA